MSETSVDGVEVTVADDVMRIVLDRPQRKNALDPPAMLRVIDALERASVDDTLRVVVVSSSSGDFCTGADWVSINTPGATRPRTGSIQRRMPLQAHRLIALLMEVQLPVVCAVQGWAAGLGCQIALAADFTVATESSRFWLPFLERGFTPDSGATWLVPRLVGVARAKELLLLGRKVTGREAADWGMVMRAVADDALDAAVDALVSALTSKSALVLAMTKQAVNAAAEALVPTGTAWSDADALQTALHDAESRAVAARYLESIARR